MLGRRPVGVDNADTRARLKRRNEIVEQAIGLGDLVIHVHQNCNVERIGWQPWIVRLAEGDYNVLQSELAHPTAQIPQIFGYDIFRDDAVMASVETRFPLLRFPSGEDRLQFAQFVDFGRAWSAKGETPDPTTLASVGVGMRWAILPLERARFEVYWGQQLNHVRRGEGNLQDYGIHLQLVVAVL